MVMSDNPFETLFGTSNEAESEDDKVKKYLLEGTGMNTETKYKLNMFDALRAMDLKNRDFYDNLNEQEKKGFAPFVMVRWASSVNHSLTEMGEWWLKATNQRFNENLLNLNSETAKHPKLQWLMATTASPGMGAMRHEWIGYKKKTTKVNNKIKNFFIAQFPSLSDDEILLLMSKVTNKEIKQYAMELGYNDKDIRAIFK
jgi:hypothetical protein